METIYKAAGVLIQDRKLLTERSHGKEFFIAPGGKIEAGETAKRALVRELKEEFSIETREEDFIPFGTFTAEAAGHPGRQVHMEVFVVERWEGEIIPDNEVEEIRWLTSKIPEDIQVGSIFEHEVIPRLQAQGSID
ncbi:MAG TPA: NUDIX domain-containing protein [Candidatus Saccharimonadales bacterium]|nr:NUDIX domain-containing protein [Candidatus Saccharimonadales bacterium]